MSEDKTKQTTPPPLLLMGASSGLTLDPPDTGNHLLPVPQTDASLFPPDDGGEEDSFLGQTQASSTPFTYFQQTPHTSSDPFASIGAGQQSVPPSSHPSIPQAPPSHSQSPPHAQTNSLFSAPHVDQGYVSSQAAPPVAAVAPFQGVSTHHTPTVQTYNNYMQPTSPQTIMTPQAPSVSPPMGAAAAVNFHRPKGPLRYAPPPVGMYAPGGPGESYPPSSVLSFPPPTSIQNIPGIPPSSSSFGGNHFMPASSEFQSDMGTSHETTLDFSSPATNGGPTGPYVTYIPVQYHWFYVKNMDLRQNWIPFSIIDSNNIEQAFISGSCDNNVVSTDGGRFDVDVIDRTRAAVYWDELTTEVRRCSWFYRPEGETRFVPYPEQLSDKLEEEYKHALSTNTWHKKLELTNTDTFVIHNPNVIVNFTASAQHDQWGNSAVSTESWSDSQRPKVVKRGVEGAFDDLIEGEPKQVDHLVFIVHGIGSTCDLRFRNIVECVDDFRAMSMQMLKSHFQQHQETGQIGRVEFLPVRWHNALHGDATGVDRKLKTITLNSIGKLRHFTNDTLLDILFYSSPAYAQQIADTIGSEMNRLHSLFKSRHPGFKGGVSVSGHSLGSLILFDLLVHQKEPGQQDHNQSPESESNIIAKQQHQDGNETSDLATADESSSFSQELSESFSKEVIEDEITTIEDLLQKLDLNQFKENFEKEHIDMETLNMCSDADLKEMGLPMGPRKKIQGLIRSHKEQKIRSEEAERAKLIKEAEMKAQEQLKEKQKEKEKAEQEKLQNEISRHPVLRSSSRSSVNYVVSTGGTGVLFVKYPQLDFQPSHFFALGSPIAMFLTVRGVDTLGDEFRFPTCPSFFNIFHPFDPVAYRVEPMIVSAFPPKPVLMPHHMGRKRLHLELKESIARMGFDIKQKIIHSVKATWRTLNDFAAAHRSAPSQEAMEEEVDSVLMQMQNGDDLTETESIASSMPDDDLLVGNINQGRRIDYVLQEKPIESFNDYLFALGSHLCYWESEDTVLMLLKEVYSMYGFAPKRPGKDPQSSGGFKYHGHTQHHQQPVAPPPSMSSGIGKPPQSFHHQQYQGFGANAAASRPSAYPPMMAGISSGAMNVGGVPPQSSFANSTSSYNGGNYGQQQPGFLNGSSHMGGVSGAHPPPSSSAGFAPPPLSGFVPTGKQ